MHVTIPVLGRGKVGDGMLELSTHMFKIQIPYPSNTPDNTLIRLAIAQFLVKLKFNQLQWYTYITHLSNQPNQYWIELQSPEGCIGLYAGEINYDPLFVVKCLKEEIVGMATDLLEGFI